MGDVGSNVLQSLILVAYAFRRRADCDVLLKDLRLATATDNSRDAELGSGLFQPADLIQMTTILRCCFDQVLDRCIAAK